VRDISTGIPAKAGIHVRGALPYSHAAPAGRGAREVFGLRADTWRQGIPST